MARVLRLMLIFGAVFFGSLATRLPQAAAGVFTLLSDPGYYNNNLPVSAMATITTTDNGTVTIDLTNMESSIISVGQVLTGFTFTLSNGDTKGDNFTGTADRVIVSSGGSFTDLKTGSIVGSILIGTTPYQGWTLGTDPSGSGPYLSAFGTGAPNFGGLNYVPDGDKYEYANASIAGNSPHNPFSRGTMEFVMNVAMKPGESAPSITGGTFQFGTNKNGGTVVSVPDNVTSTPEPASLVCWCLLGLSAVGYRRRASRNRSSAG